MTCTHEETVGQVVTALDGYFAVYRVEGQAHAALNNVVAWEARKCTHCHDVITHALIVKAYHPTLVRAESIEGFVGISGPAPNADQKSVGNKMLEQEKAARTQEAARRAALRTVTSMR